MLTTFNDLFGVLLRGKEEALEKVTESSEPAGGMTDGCVEGSLLLGLVLFSASCQPPQR